MRYPLVDGQGNFGSVDGDPPAAMRYTESRLEALAEELMADLDKETVDFVPNYDETTEEPSVLPASFPNLLVNGSSGIAVGMATNIPPHNLGEVIDALDWLIDRQQAQANGEPPVVARGQAASRAQLVPGPDFPTGGDHRRPARHLRGLHDRPRLDHGAGEVHLRGDGAATATSIVVTELPYQVNKAKLLEKIAELVAREGHRRHHRPPRRIRSRRHARGDRAEARRTARGRAQQPLQAHAAADDLRRHHAGDRRRPAARAAAASSCSSCSSSSAATSSAGAPSSSCGRRRPAPTSSRV